MKMLKTVRLRTLCALGVVGLMCSMTSSHGLKIASAAEEEYDRLDGMGSSGKKVNVIEWEGNLEVHVYPAGSLKGLALKLDKKNKDKPVMVIGYRFENKPQTQLIRRAILGIEMREGFKAYRDKSADGYDKIVISNSDLGGSLAAYKLEAEPVQLYPEGHPMLAAGADADSEKRSPAASESRKKAQEDTASEDKAALEDSGSIHPFLMRANEGHHQL